MTWLAVIAWLVYEWRADRHRGAVAFLLFLGTFIVQLLIASDVSRSMSVFVPAALVGALVWWQHQPARASRVLQIAAGLNLLLPAIHVTGTAVWPIRYLYGSLDELRDVPAALTPQPYVNNAMAMINDGKFEDAVRSATVALELAPAYAPALAVRANAYFHLKRLKEALADANVAVQREPHNPYYANNRACIRVELGDTRGAIADLEQALREPAAPAALKTQMQATLAEARRRL
jgi:tetratricopeptide (TPR) repeat protein